MIAIRKAIVSQELKVSKQTLFLIVILCFANFLFEVNGGLPYLLSKILET